MVSSGCPLLLLRKVKHFIETKEDYVNVERNSIVLDFLLGLHNYFGCFVSKLTLSVFH